MELSGRGGIRVESGDILTEVRLRCADHRDGDISRCLRRFLRC
jgi:hypothetical protein